MTELTTETTKLHCTMAQTKRKRRTKHRGTPAGTIQTRGRTGRPPSADERKKTSVDLWAIAGKRGLRYLPISGTLERLQLLNLPAILELSVPT